MSSNPTEISNALEVVEQYLDGIDFAIAADHSQGRQIVEEHSPRLEQIAEMGRYARSMIDGYLDLDLGTAPERLPTPDTPEQKLRYDEQARELYVSLVSEKNVWERLPEDKRDQERVGIITKRIKELDEYLFAREVIDATFG